MPPSDTRTGNLLLKREIFDDPDNRFEPQFGRTGGEDVWFFVKVSAKGTQASAEVSADPATVGKLLMATFAIGMRGSSPPPKESIELKRGR